MKNWFGFEIEERDMYWMKKRIEWEKKEVDTEPI